MKFLLSIVILALTAVIQADIYRETHLIEIVLPQNDPDYDPDVEYRLLLDGYENYKVTLQTWKYVDEGVSGIKSLRFQSEQVLFDKIPVKVRVAKRDVRHDLATIDLIEGDSATGSLNFKNNQKNDEPPSYGALKLLVRAEALRKIFSKSNTNEKVFYPDSTWFSSLNQRYGQFDPDVKEIKHGSYVRAGGIDGDDVEVFFTEAVVYGNQVTKIRYCGTGVLIPDPFDLKILARQGFTALYLEGNNKGRCIELLDKNSKSVYKVTL